MTSYPLRLILLRVCVTKCLKVKSINCGIWKRWELTRLKITNYSTSLRRLKSQVARLEKEPEVLREYASIINDQLDSGVIEKVVELEMGEKVHQLPHQAVIRKEARTSKVRIVYDTSSKEKKSGTSLNDCLHVEPLLNPLLYDILL